MVYRLVPATVIKSKIVSDFRPTDNFWTTNLNNWIGEAMKAIGCYSTLEKTSQEVRVKHGRAPIPCNLEALYYIEANGTRLTITGSVRNAMKGERYDIGSGYVASPGYIHTPFNSGMVTFYYAALPVHVDGEGKECPMVIDAYEYMEAVTWYCMMKMLSTGYEHKVHNYTSAKNEWETFRDAAQRHAKSMTADELELFGNMWTNKFSSSTFSSSYNQSNDSGEGVRRAQGPSYDLYRKPVNRIDTLRENGINFDN